MADPPPSSPRRLPAAVLVCGALFLLLLTACTPPEPPLPILIPTQPNPTTALPPADPTPQPADSGWLPIQPGLEKRIVPLPAPGGGAPLERLTILRVDPQMFRFEVGYAPGDPRTLRQWLVDREAVAVANGGFFTPEWIATGLLISDGQRFGASYGPRAGMVAIPEDGPPQVRWLQATPYDPSEALAGGIQAFPMLVRPGGQIGVPDELPNDRPDRRTAIGQDGEGRLLFIIAPRGGLTLHAFSQTLAGGGFGLDVALNLDGGTSSGLLWVEGGETAGIPPFSPLPVVLLVLPK